MKKFFETILGLVFWVSLILTAGAAEADKWGWAVVFLAIFAITCLLSNKFVEPEKID